MWRATLPKRLDPSERPSYFKTHEEATAWLDAEIKDRADKAARAVAVPSAEMTLEDYLIAWLSLVAKSEDWSPRSIQSKLTHIKYLGDLLLRALGSITRLDLQAVVAELQQPPKPSDGQRPKGEFTRRKAVGSAYLHGVIATWRRAFRDAVDDGLIPTDPTAKLQLPPRRISRRPSWTPAEARLLVPEIIGQRYEADYALIFGCALRIGEVRGLAWVDVHEHEQRAWIWQQADGPRILQRVKGGQGKWVHLPGPVLDALARRRLQQTWIAVYVCEHAPGVRVSRDNLVDDLRKLAISVGVRPFSPHAGRHAVGNVLGAGNVPLATIADRLRHTSRRVTADWYLESDDAGEALATQLLEALFTGRPSESNHDEDDS